MVLHYKISHNNKKGFFTRTRPVFSPSAKGEFSLIRFSDVGVFRVRSNMGGGEVFQKRFGYEDSTVAQIKHFDFFLSFFFLLKKKITNISLPQTLQMD